MRILLDTNIILDSLLARMPFFEDADRLFQAIRSGQIIGYVTATTLRGGFSPIFPILQLTLINPPDLTQE